MPNFKFSQNSIKVTSSPYYFIIPGAIGFICLGSGLLLVETIHPFEHILFSAGIVLCSIALAMSLNTEYYKIYINDEPGYISVLESTGSSITPFKIPVSFYSGIFVLPGSPADSNSYDVNLQNNTGSSLFIKKFTTKQKALEFALQLQKMLGLNLHSDSSLKNAAEKISGHAVKLDITLPINSSLKKVVKNNVPCHTWSNRKNLLYYAGLLGVVYAMAHFSFFVLREYENLFTVFTVFNVLTVLIGLIALFSSTVDIFSIKFLMVNKQEVIYYTRLFGKNWNEHRMARDEIALVKNTLDMKEGKVTLFSKSVYTALKEMAVQFEKGNGFDINDISTLISMKNGVIEINTKSLSITEKFYLESVILANFS